MKTTGITHHLPTHSRRLALLSGLAGLLVWALSPARAATLTVVNLDDSGPGSLRQAIADAAPGDTIDFGVTGTITLTSGELVIDKSLTISGPGRTNLTVSGNNASRVFNIGTASAAVEISGLAISNGNPGPDDGGGIKNGGNLTVSHCLVSDCTAVMAGAGIYSGNASTLRVVNSIISHNSCWSGGGWGAGIACPWYNIRLTIINSLISSNYNPSGGGAIMLGNGGIGAITNTTFSGNVAGGAGGAVYTQDAASLSLDSCTITGNTAGEYGGGGIHNFAGSTSYDVRNCVVAGNTADVGPDCYGPIASLDFNLIGNTNGCTITGTTTHDIYNQDPLLGPLADNGGPTWTHALLAGSPAIDHGSSNGLTTDQRGKTRPCNFASTPDADDGSDIGAFEVQGRSVTTLDDSGPGSLRQAIAEAAPGDTIDFAVTGTITLTSGELVIDKDLTIAGPGATNLTVSGNNASRVFHVLGGVVAVSGLTTAEGNGGNNGDGGGIRNLGNLGLSDCAITKCSTYSGSHGGGGVLNWGTLVLRRCTVSDNGSGGGGGVQNLGAFTASDCTFSGNFSGTGGGGIYNFGDWGATAILRSCTVCSNVATGGGGLAYGGGIATRGGTPVILQNCLVSGNRAELGPDISDTAFAEGLVFSEDFNLVGSTNGCTITGDTTHNIYGKDPLLGPLADNGGPTWTHALLPGSPAIDHGSSNGLTTDQRGLARSVDFPAYYDAADASDIGAVEMQEAPQTGPVLTVNATDDSDDSVAGIAHCSLREAIHAANSTPGSNSIVFATTVPGVMTGVTGTVTLTNGQLSISEDLSVVGPGAKELTISGNDSSRIFHIPGPFLVTLSGLMLADGLAKGPNTGAGESYGGAIFSQGRLQLEQCILRDNAADESGGAVYHSSYSGGTLTVLESVLHNNEARSGVGGAICNSGLAAVIASCISSNQAGGGGGIWGVFAGSDTRLTNTTISCNTASDTGGGLGFAIDSTLSADSCTICSNRAGAYGGGISLGGEYDDLFTLRNCIVAGNSALTSPDVSGPRELISGDFNLVQNTNGITIIGLTTHNLYNQDPKLGPLADLGGPTPTHALRYDSPAIDAGHSGGLTTDQRGLLRPIDDPTTPNADGGDGSDIGAYEADPNLRILAIEKADADIRLRFNTVLDLTYRIDAKDRIEDSWFTLLDSIPGAGSSAQVLDAGAATLPKRFYRVVAP